MYIIKKTSERGNAMECGFAALLARMNYIARWGLMRNTRAESLSEHTLMTALTAHLLALLAKNMFFAEVDPERVACGALYHDVSEIMTGDMPTPVKYHSERLREEYKAVERESAELIASMLPDCVKGELRQLMLGETLCERERQIIKAADKLSALVKCIEEENNGNTEFSSAKQSTLKTLRADPNPETAYYLEHFVPPFSKTLDELLENAE